MTETPKKAPAKRAKAKAAEPKPAPDKYAGFLTDEFGNRYSPDRDLFHATLAAGKRWMGTPSEEETK